jgi:hypothetical protein
MAGHVPLFVLRHSIAVGAAKRQQNDSDIVRFPLDLAAVASRVASRD